MSDIHFSLRQNTLENLENFTHILNKDMSEILEEALEQYFQSEQEKLIAKNQADENAMTNLDFDEFWDGVDF